jgi:hypothetical protein
MMFPLLHAWTATLALIAAVERPHMDRVLNAVDQVAPGADEQQVLHALGPPDVKWAKRTGVMVLLFGSMPRQWSYGTIVDAENLFIAETGWPNPAPIKIRLFGPNANDVVVTWRDDGMVAAVDRPPTRPRR